MVSVAPIGSPNHSTHSDDFKATKCQTMTNSKYSTENLSVERCEDLGENNRKRLDCSMVDCVYQILCAPVCGVIGCLICFTDCCCVRYGED